MEARGNVPPQTIPEGGRFEGRPRPAFDPRFDRRAHLIRGLGGYREIQYSSSTCDSLVPAWRSADIDKRRSPWIP